MKVISPNTFKSPVYRVLAHLSDEERLDQACELLAEGVLRLAEKRGLLKGPKAAARQAPEKAKENV
ncbi:MAG TPA: hypothetical protein PLX96_05795 [Candidatus Omnitrophota bacterium]|nr:hypothetical protein [Candidatus Omnitrophota bacterium]